MQDNLTIDILRGTRQDVNMTRINVIPPSELSDQHLIAEYHELPRVLKQNINICGAPDCYTLGAGHMRWACRFWKFTYDRFFEICDEMRFRGFAVNFDPETLGAYTARFCGRSGEYTVTDADIEKCRARIRDKYNMKPEFYRWTKRTRPTWLDN